MRRFIVGLLATVGTLTLLAIGGIAAFIASGPFSSKPLPQSMVLSLDLRNVPPEIDVVRPAARRAVRQLARHRRHRPAPVAGSRRSARRRPVRRHRRRIAPASPACRSCARRSPISAARASSRSASPNRWAAAAPTSPTTISPRRWSRSGCSRAAASPWPASPSRRRSSRPASTSSACKVEGGKRYEYKSAPDTLPGDRLHRPGAREPAAAARQPVWPVRERRGARTPHRAGQAAPADRCRTVRFGAGATGRPGRQGRLSQRCAGRGRDSAPAKPAISSRSPTTPPTRRGPSRAATVVALVRVSGAIASGPGSDGPLDDDVVAHGRGRGRRARPGGQGQGGARHRAAHRFARRHLSRRRCHRRRRRPRPLGGQAGDRLDGRRRGVGRLSRRHSRPTSSWPSPPPSPPRSACSASGRSPRSCWPRWASGSSGWRSAPMPACIRPSSRRRRHSAPRSARELDTVYAEFTRQVGEARKLDGARLDAAARGRVFSGVDAKQRRPGRRAGRPAARAQHRQGQGRHRRIAAGRDPPLPGRVRPLAEDAGARPAAGRRRGQGSRRFARRARCARPWRGSASWRGPATSACRRCRRSGARGERWRESRGLRRRGAAAPAPRPGHAWADAGARRCAPPARRRRRGRTGPG